jgi:hypothetical protein
VVLPVLKNIKIRHNMNGNKQVLKNSLHSQQNNIRHGIACATAHGIACATASTASSGPEAASSVGIGIVIDRDEAGAVRSGDHAVAEGKLILTWHVFITVFKFNIQTNTLYISVNAFYTIGPTY